MFLQEKLNLSKNRSDTEYHINCHGKRHHQDFIFSRVCFAKSPREDGIPDPTASQPPLLKIDSYGSGPTALTQHLRVWPFFLRRNCCKFQSHEHEILPESEAEHSNGTCYLVLAGCRSCSSVNPDFTELLKCTQPSSALKDAKIGFTGTSAFSLRMVPKHALFVCHQLCHNFVPKMSAIHYATGFHYQQSQPLPRSDFICFSGIGFVSVLEQAHAKI